MRATYKAAAKKVEGGLKVESRARSFTLICDEPVGAGGTNTGMSPVEALLCALGSCQTIAAHYLAQGQGIEVKGFSVELEGDVDADGFMGANPDVRCGFSEIRVRMHIDTDAPAEEAERFVRLVEERCPVGETIRNGVPVVLTGVSVGHLDCPAR